MVQDVGVVTPGFFQGVGQDRQGVEVAFGVDGFGQAADRVQFTQ